MNYSENAKRLKEALALDNLNTKWTQAGDNYVRVALEIRKEYSAKKIA